ncbi:hypothetical protein [Rhodoplanes roseus]|uniref:Lipoprotein SmpA/OmlA domain-containing protein n=1 Tax=Rhodoplanes roseus TaxID=29409 RepID=A0A327KM09_9BRAD|nr:hypothetical protein [Rhodoplanes roseus]RAI38495.1 hypothetical protein CH341_27735 [Rhodoplanes roseus]
MRRAIVGLAGALACAAVLGGCVTTSTTAPNTAPLELGMTPPAVAAALGVPLEPISAYRGTSPAGSDVFVARLPAATPGLTPVDGLVWLQFRKGRLTGYKRDWHIGPGPTRPF